METNGLTIYRAEDGLDRWVLWVSRQQALINEPEPALEWVEVDWKHLLWPDYAPRPSKGCLRAFVKLHGAPDAEFLGYSEEWGQLGIWPHSITSERVQDSHHGELE